MTPPEVRPPEARLSFRSEALQEYRHRRVEAAAPAYRSPRALAPLWLVVLLLGGLAAGILRHLVVLLSLALLLSSGGALAAIGA